MAFSPISADEVFCNGQIRPIFPVHKRNLSTGDAGILCRNSNSSSMQAVKARLPLRKLLIEGRETEKLESDSKTGAEETYCVWEPKLGDDAGDGGGCTKSNKSSTATGSSKWWKHLLSTPKRRYCRFT
nr:histone-lysine N-methyltransferase SETD1B [Ipomoea batatas]